jgi:hypothetical protein
MKATYNVNFWNNGLPSWVMDVSYRLSRTGQSVLITVTGRMHPDSKMPGGTYKCYVPAIDFASRPDRCVNRALNNSDAKVRRRFYGSHLVWTARNNLSKALAVKLSARLRLHEHNIYTSERAQSLVRRILQIKGVAFCPEVLCFPKDESECEL